MTRSNWFLLGAMIAAVLGGLGGFYVVGIAINRTYTAAGMVDMSDVHAITRAFKDPTLTSSLTWGDFSLVGRYWGIAIPFLCAFVPFVLILIIGRRRKQ